jgi:transposase-like protein
MSKSRPALFRGRHFADEMIILCVRWYLQLLSCRDLEEIMAERNLRVDHTTVWRWVQRCALELNRRVRRELKPTGGSWRVDESYVSVAGRWACPYRAVDSTGATIDFYLSEQRDAMAAKQFFGKALGSPPSSSPESHQRMAIHRSQRSWRNCSRSTNSRAAAGVAPASI